MKHLGNIQISDDALEEESVRLFLKLYWRPKVTRKFAALETEQYFEKFVISMILTHMPMIVQALPLYFCTRQVWGIA